MRWQICSTHRYCFDPNVLQCNTVASVKLSSLLFSENSPHQCIMLSKNSCSVVALWPCSNVIDVFIKSEALVCV